MQQYQSRRQGEEEGRRERREGKGGKKEGGAIAVDNEPQFNEPQ